MTILKRTSKSATIELKTDYLLIKFIDKSTIDLSEARIISHLSLELFKGKPHSVVLYGLDRSIQMDNVTRDYFANDPHLNSLTKSMAIVVNNTPSRLLARFYIQFNKPQSPIKIFRTLKEAEDWIRTFA